MYEYRFYELCTWKAARSGSVRFVQFLTFIFLVTAAALAAGDSWSSVSDPGVNGTGSIPFIANLGQMDKEVAFYTINRGSTLFVTMKGEIVHAVAREGPAEGIVLRERVLDSQCTAAEGSGLTDTRINWYRGSDPAGWRHDLPVYRSVNLHSLYGNIDASLVVRRQGVEKLFTIHPGGDVSDIRIQVESAASMGTNGSGELVVDTPGGQVLFTRPEAYQFKEGLKREVVASYWTEGNEYGFSVEDYDHSLTLIIDPLLASTVLGGKGNETAYAVKVYDGDVFVAGTTDSVDFPGAGEWTARLGDAFVFRLNRDLTTIQAATFIGGSLTEGARGMVVDASGVYIAGYNNSLDFPTTHGAVYAGSAISGAFVTRLDTNTLQMTASTAFYPNLFAITRGPGDSVIVGGATSDPLFPLVSGNSYMTELQGGADAFVARLSGDLQVMEASTLLGGEGVDIIYDLAVDVGGDLLASGVTNSTAFPVSESAFDTTYNLDWEETLPWRDGFVARFSDDLTELLASTYLGGGWNDSIQALVVDGSDVMVGGNTASVDFPCGNTFGPVDGNDAFVFRFDRTLSTIQSCALFGGGEAAKGSPDTVTDIATPSRNRIIVTGRTDADDYPTTPGAFLERPIGSYTGGFITSFTPDLAYMEASTLVHGNNEYLHSIALGTAEDLFVAGDAQSDDYFVTPGAVQTLHGGGDDLVVSRFSDDLTGPHIELDPTVINFKKVPTGKSKSGMLTVYNTGGAQLRISELTLLPGSLSSFTLEGSCTVIPVFDSCQVEIVFTPTKPGSMEGTLLVFSNDLFNREKTVNLVGTGISGPVIDIDQSRLFFGNVIPGMASSVRQVTVTNVGTGDLGINDVLLEGPNSSSFILTARQCTADPLPEGGECRISLQFVPSEEGGRSAFLRIMSNDPARPVYQIYLEGRGVASPDIGGPVEGDAMGSNGSTHFAGEQAKGDDGWLPGLAGSLGIVFLCGVLWLAVKFFKKPGSSISGNVNRRIRRGTRRKPNH